MSLSALIRKRGTGDIATAIPATDGAPTVATVAIAKPAQGQAAPASTEKTHVPSSANQWRLHYGDGRTREIAFAPALTERQVRAQYQDAVGAIEIGSTLTPELFRGNSE